MTKSKASRIIAFIDSIVTWAAALFFIVLIAYGAYCIWDSQQVYAAADASNFTPYKPNGDGLDFEELRAKNPDVFGWIDIYGTAIDYPLVQGLNNDDYVNRDVLGEYSLSGSIFLDADKPKDFSAFTSIIYGHHMEQSKMFGDIDHFADEDFFNSHQYGSLYYDDKEHGLEIFSYIECNAYDEAVYGDFEDDKKGRFIDNIGRISKYYRDIDLSEEDHIVLLSTCDYSYTDGRMVLAARISDDLFENEFTD